MVRRQTLRYPRPSPFDPGVCLLRVLLGTLALTVAAQAAEPVGYRRDGSGRYATATTAFVEAPTPTWSTPTVNWSNAAVTPCGPLVCTTEEPTTLLCLRADTGAVAWRATNDYADTLPAEARAAHLEKAAGVDALRTALRASQRTFSELRRAVRADPSKVEQLTATQRTLEAQRSELDALAPYLTPPNKEIIGYASATPVCANDTLYAQFANGVTSSFALDGTRRWSVYLGPASDGMRGYHLGASASPLMVDGQLISTHGHLAALDPATGTTRWKAELYRDYGTPALVRVQGEALLATPEGRLVRAADGTEVQTDLGDVHFTGPLLHDEVLYWVGGPATEHMMSKGYMEGHAWAATALPPVRRWQSELPILESLYSTPVAHDGILHVADRSGTLHRISLASGEHLSQEPLRTLGPLGPVYAPLTLAGDRLYLIGEEGLMIVTDLSTDPPTRTTLELEGSRAGVTVDPQGRAYVRTLAGVQQFGSRR